jgi:hypothetical protein
MPIQLKDLRITQFEWLLDIVQYVSISIFYNEEKTNLFEVKPNMIEILLFFVRNLITTIFHFKSESYTIGYGILRHYIIV